MDHFPDATLQSGRSLRFIRGCALQGQTWGLVNSSRRYSTPRQMTGPRSRAWGPGFENPAWQVHRSLPAQPARKPGRPGVEGGRALAPGSRDAPGAQASVPRPSYAVYSPPFERSPARGLPALHTHPDTWASQ